MADDRERWNAKFLAGEGQLVDPDPFLIEVCADLRPGNALDLAGGAGRHAIWLARHGWRVTLSDVSDEGVALARQRCGQAAVHVDVRRESLAETVAWASGSGIHFNLITIFWFLARDAFDALPALLAPGGLLVYKTYTSENARFADGKPTHYALRPDELRTAFPTLQTVLYREAEGVSELAARAH
ncbi:MAG TPA: class I SAM-dependent methyltransferase [Acidobacteriaceae bacterium]|nr:class I SAM-dependent methyltransferase [Acidobacteriaceae bacterium]